MAAAGTGFSWRRERRGRGSGARERLGLVLSLLQASSHFLAEASGCLHGQASVEPQARQSPPKDQSPPHRASPAGTATDRFRALLPGSGSWHGLGHLFWAGSLWERLWVPARVILAG